MRTKWYMLVVGLALLLGPAVATSQFGQPGGFGGGGPGGFGGGGRGNKGMGGGQPGGRGQGGGGFQMDPNQMWTNMSQGKDPITRNDVPAGFMQNMFDGMMQRMNNTTGRLSKDQFVTYMQQRAAGRNGAAPPGGPPAAVGAPAGPSGPDPNAIAEGVFRRMDTNGDGLLNFDEMNDTLRAERDKWDTNKDGFIDLNEFKEYMKVRISQFQQGNGGAGGAGGTTPNWVPPQIVIEQEEEKRPTVYRAGKLPPNLPAWFAECDRDGDGQVGLYEWKSAGKPMEQFAALDRNGDGFITVEEALRSVPATATVSAGGGPLSPGGNVMTGGGPPMMMGGGGQSGGGFGGFGGGQPGGGFGGANPAMGGGGGRPQWGKGGTPGMGTGGDQQGMGGKVRRNRGLPGG